MNNIFFVITFLFSINFFAQTYFVEYKEVISLGVDKTPKELQQLFLTSEGHKATLVYSQGKSKYTYNAINVDEYESTNNGVVISLPEIYKNLTNKTTQTYYPNFEPQFYGNSIKVEENDYNLLEWEITSAKTLIAGYKCTMATAINKKGLIINAWYTEDIPINDGPRIFYSLPGLILQVQYNDKVLVCAQKISMIAENTDIEIAGTIDETMNLKEFEVLKKKLYEPREFIDRQGNKGFIINDKAN